MSALQPSVEDALADWEARVRANREQVDRFREVADGDFYAPLAHRFRADPTQAEDPALAALLALAEPDDVWLDLGAGGGRVALPLAQRVREVIALDHSNGMHKVLEQSITDYAATNVRPERASWPVDDVHPYAADVALISHVGYDVECIGPFLDAMERAARRLCVAVLFERPAPYLYDQLWPAVHGETRAPLPALPEFLALLLARSRLFEVRLVSRPPQPYAAVEDVLGLARRQLWTRPDSEKDRQLQATLRERLQERAGGFSLSWEPVRTGIVTWTRR